jgi:hypothetical protein
LHSNGSTIKYIKKHVSLKEDLLRLKRGRYVLFLREI